MPSATPENAVKNAIKAGLSVSRTKPSRWPGLRLFSNPSGMVKVDNRFITYGLGQPLKSSDQIGYKTVTITADMVGKRIAQFYSIEIKRPGGKLTEGQRQWLSMIKEAGGKAGVVASVEALDAIVQSDA